MSCPYTPLLQEEDTSPKPEPASAEKGLNALAQLYAKLRLLPKHFSNLQTLSARLSRLKNPPPPNATVSRCRYQSRLFITKWQVYSRATASIRLPHCDRNFQSGVTILTIAVRFFVGLQALDHIGNRLRRGAGQSLRTRECFSYGTISLTVPCAPPEFELSAAVQRANAPLLTDDVPLLHRRACAHHTQVPAHTIAECNVGITPVPVPIVGQGCGVANPPARRRQSSASDRPNGCRHGRGWKRSSP